MSQDRGIVSKYDLKKKSNFIIYCLMVLLVILMAITMLYPIAITFFNSFKENKEVNSFPPTFLPSSWHWDAFVQAWGYIDLANFFRNTLVIFAGDVVVMVFVLGLSAFALSKLNLPYKKLVTAFFMSTLFIPSSTYIIPNFLNLKDLGLLNSFWAFWLPSGGNAFFLLLLKTFFDDLEDELFEAARLDGASEVRIFLQIALPLSLPIFATLTIFTFSSVWNDWFWPSLVIHDENMYPLSTAIYKYVIQARSLNLNVKFAILSLVMLPPIVIFLFLQKYIMRGLSSAAIK